MSPPLTHKAQGSSIIHRRPFNSLSTFHSFPSIPTVNLKNTLGTNTKGADRGGYVQPLTVVTMAKTKTTVISALAKSSKSLKRKDHQVEEAATSKRIDTLMNLTLTNNEGKDNDKDNGNANIESSLVDRYLTPYESWEDDGPLSIAYKKVFSVEVLQLDDNDAVGNNCAGDGKQPITRMMTRRQCLRMTMEAATTLREVMAEVRI